MGVNVGIDCKFYRNTGTWASPVWVEFTLTRDVATAMSKTRANAGARLSRFAKKAQGLKSITFEVTALQDSTDASYQAFRDAWINDTLLTVAMANGVISTTGTNYLKADTYVFGCNPDQPLEEAETTKFEFELAYSVNDPLWVTT